MSFLTQLWTTLFAMFGEPCDRCGQTLKMYPLFALEVGTDLVWINKLLTLDASAGEGAAEQDVAALMARVAAYATEPIAYGDGVVSSIKWCNRCEQGTLQFKLVARGAAVEEAEYSLFNEAHKRLARSVQELHEARAKAGEAAK